MVASWTRGARMPSGVYAFRLIQVLDVEADDLVGPLEGSEVMDSGRRRAQKRRPGASESSEGRRLLRVLEAFVADFRSYLRPTTVSANPKPTASPAERRAAAERVPQQRKGRVSNP